MRKKDWDSFIQDFTSPAAGFDSGHFGHHDVEKNYLRLDLGQQVQDLDSVLYRQDIVAGHRERVRIELVERAIGFYCEVLGCREERRVESINLVQLRAGASLIDLIPAESAPQAGGGNMDHFALRIEPFDEAALRRHLESHGVEAGELATRFGAEGQGPSLYIKDPDGNTVELKGPPNG